MPNTPEQQVVEALLTETRTAHGDRNWPRALEAAEVGWRAAERIDDGVLLVRALYWERLVLWMLHDTAGALVRDVRILSVAEDPARRDEFARYSSTDWYIATTRCNVVAGVLAQSKDPARLR